MVFESVVIELLNRYLKPYVKRLDTSQLKVGVWKGETVVYTHQIILTSLSHPLTIVCSYTC